MTPTMALRSRLSQVTTSAWRSAAPSRRSLHITHVRPFAPPLLSRPAIRAKLHTPTRVGGSRLTPKSRTLPTHIGARYISDAVRGAIDKAVASAPVVLFMKGTPDLPQCGFSRASVQLLGMQGVDPAKFAAYNVLEDPELRAGIKEYSDWPTIPQLYVDGDFVGGCDILMTMNQNGELAKLLTDKGVLVTESESESSSPPP